MLSGSEEAFMEMVHTIKQLSEDEKIRMQCEARERYERDRISELKCARREGFAEGYGKAQKEIEDLKKELERMREKYGE